jgi:hypothetical protein
MNGTDGSKDNEGTGPEGTIPDSKDGIGITSTEAPSNFEPEEDEPTDDDAGN